MTNAANAKARLLAKYAAEAREEVRIQSEKRIDLTPILDHLNKTLAYVEGNLVNGISLSMSAQEINRAIHFVEWKEKLENLIARFGKEQTSPKTPNIHILSIYLFPDLYAYGSKYEPTNDCNVSPVYDAVGKVLCDWSGHQYWG